MSDTVSSEASPARQEVEDAFRKAQEQLGTTWQLKGRGHCRRATLKGRYSGPASRGASASFVLMRLHASSIPSRLFPLDLVEEAARILAVDPSVIISVDRSLLSGTMTVKVGVVPARDPNLRRVTGQGNAVDKRRKTV